LASDAQVNSPFSYEEGDVRCREENQRKGKVFDQGNVQSVVTMELNIGSREKVET